MNVDFADARIKQMALRALRTGVTIAALPFWLALLFAPLVSSVVHVQAATLTAVTPPQMCNLLFFGPVQEGDLDSLKSAISSMPAGDPVNLCLNGPGGSFNEALRVVEFIAKSGRAIRTLIDRGAECYSACALIFMAGRTADREPQPDRKLHVLGKLAFHAPFIKPGANNYDASVVEMAHREALRALARFLELNDKDFFSEDLLTRMLLKKSNEFLTVDTTEDAGRWRIDLLGYRKPASITPLLLQQACKNEMEWSQGVENSNARINGKPIAFKDRKFRAVIPDFGDEGASVCVVDGYNDPARGVFISLMFASDVTDDEVPKPNDLENKVKALGDPLAIPGKPLWYLYSPESKLKNLAEK
jgi:hypothetical protein